MHGNRGCATLIDWCSWFARDWLPVRCRFPYPKSSILARYSATIAVSVRIVPSCHFASMPDFTHLRSLFYPVFIQISLWNRRRAFFKMEFMPRHNRTEISIRSVNIISDYTMVDDIHHGKRLFVPLGNIKCLPDAWTHIPLRYRYTYISYIPLVKFDCPDSSFFRLSLHQGRTSTSPCRGTYLSAITLYTNRS